MSNEKVLVFGICRSTLTLRCGQGKGGEENYETVLGGHGETMAAAIARLGGKSVFCGRVGDDSGGKRLVRLLDEAGVDLSCFRVDREAQTGFAVHILRAGAAEETIVFPGADKNLNEEQIRTAFLCAPDAVCLSAALPRPAIDCICRLAREHGVPVFLNYGIDGAEIAGLAELEVFSPDGEAAEALTGVRPAGAESCLSAAIEMQKRVRARYYVIRLGERGAFVYDGTYCHMVSSYVMQQTDPRGAEDVFFAAMVLEYLRVGRDILPACAYAAAAAALTVARTGEAASVPDADEVLSFLEKS